MVGSARRRLGVLSAAFTPPVTSGAAAGSALFGLAIDGNVSSDGAQWAALLVARGDDADTARRLRDEAIASLKRAERLDPDAGGVPGAIQHNLEKARRA